MAENFRTWTPEIYETLHKLLLHLSQGIEAPLNQLAELLELVFPVFSSVLRNPLPSEEDRTKLLARIRSFTWCLTRSFVESGRVGV
jgi:hypothetical protein